MTKTITETHHKPCGCLTSTTTDEHGKVLYTDDAWCRMHTELMWHKLDTSPPKRTRVVFTSPDRERTSSDDQ